MGEATTAADSWSIEPRDGWEDTYDNASVAGKGTNPRSDPMAPVQALPIHHLQRTFSSAKPATSVLGKEVKERKAGEAEERKTKEGIEKARTKAEQEDAARLARLKEEEQWQRRAQPKPAPTLMINERVKDTRLLASGSYDKTVKIWDPATGKCVLTLKGHSNSVYSVAWSYDAARLASGSSDNTVKIWDPATGQCVSTLNGHSNTVWSVAWSYDAARLASGSRDNTVKIWDPATGQCVSTLKGHGRTVCSVAWSHR
ncbi:WD40-repeat-containing domain protein [Cladorrhinum sp. PSN259]|nr:WD40-repeat-containing domain protein [Cladorrhinum sp. PSN259]